MLVLIKECGDVTIANKRALSLNKEVLYRSMMNAWGVEAYKIMGKVSKGNRRNHKLQEQVQRHATKVNNWLGTWIVGNYEQKGYFQKTIVPLCMNHVWMEELGWW